MAGDDQRWVVELSTHTVLKSEGKIRVQCRVLLLTGSLDGILLMKYTSSVSEKVLKESIKEGIVHSEGNLLSGLPAGIPESKNEDLMLVFLVAQMVKKLPAMQETWV